MAIFSSLGALVTFKPILNDTTYWYQEHYPLYSNLNAPIAPNFNATGNIVAINNSEGERIMYGGNIVINSSSRSYAVFEQQLFFANTAVPNISNRYSFTNESQDNIVNIKHDNASNTFTFTFAF